MLKSFAIYFPFHLVCILLGILYCNKTTQHKTNSRRERHCNIKKWGTKVPDRGNGKERPADTVPTTWAEQSQGQGRGAHQVRTDEARRSWGLASGPQSRLLSNEEADQRWRAPRRARGRKTISVKTRSQQNIRVQWSLPLRPAHPLSSKQGCPL